MLLLKIGPYVLVREATHKKLREIAITCIVGHLGEVVDVGGVKISRELIPQLLDDADGASITTRDGRRYRLRRDSDTFVVNRETK